MVQQVKRTLLLGARISGLDVLLARSRWRNNRLLILCYHGISIEREHEWDPNLYMSPQAFRRRLELLARHRCTVLPLSEALDRSAQANLPPRSVVITFDDGMFDFYHHAVPTLQQFGFPATVYVSTFYSRFQRPVFYVACSYLLWKHRSTAKPGALAEISDWLNGAGPSAEQQQAALEELAHRYGEDLGEWSQKRILHLMTPEELREVASQGFSLQLHTHRHRTPLDPILFAREIDENRAYVQAWTGQKTDHFCYPNGTVHAEFLPWLQSAGVRSAVTCAPGLTLPADNRLLLPRLVDHSNLSETEFESWLSGTGALLHGFRPRSDRNPLPAGAFPQAARVQHAPE